jgi:hypothetical protein
MASTNNNKEKTPSEDDHQNPKLEEEVESEAKEEIEEDQHPCPRAVIASIGVVTNPNKFKKGAQICTGGNVPRHLLAPRTSSSVQRKKAPSVKKSGETIPRARIRSPIGS